MCGIAGYLDLEGGPPQTETVRAMAALLAHRGPDGEETETMASGGQGPTVVLGHRRLAIIDLTKAAAQPLSGEDGTVVVDFNGEIYNFRELRSELEAKGHRFRSRSDTEVIVHAYEEMGDAFVSRLDGMFAFALWDGRRRRLVLARDRAGKKPLYYAWDGRRLTFASEMKALGACPWVDRRIDWEQLHAYLTLGYVPSPATMLQGIRGVPAASTLVVDERGPGQPVRYWQLSYGEESARRPDWAEATATVRDLVREAVRRRLMADVPLGVLLSGGLDSSMIVAMMASLGAPIRTFTIGVDEPSYDERRFAALVARRFHTDHTEVVVKADAMGLLERLAWFLDQPFADSSAVPTYLITRAARQFVTVALTGDGGDEVFGGYERFAAALLADRLPGLLQRGLAGAAGVLPRTSGYFDLRRRVERFAARPGSSPEERYLEWVAVAPGAEARSLMAPDLRAMAGDDPAQSFHRAARENQDLPLLHRLLAANFATYLHDDLLVKMDRMAMANSLETRAPLLDTALMEMVADLPPSFKATSFGLKRLLRRAARGLVPPEILRRRKHGFGVPVGRWFRRELREPFVELVLGRDARSAPVIDRPAVRELFREHLEGRADRGARLWSLLSLEMWLRTMERPAGSPPPPEPQTAVLERAVPSA